MERKTGGRVDSTGVDNLIAKLYPQPDSFIVELKTPGEYKRGTVLSLESDGKYEILGEGTGKASAVLADDTLEEDESAVAYRSGHFNRKALIFGVVKAEKKDGEEEAGEDTAYELTATDEDDLRRAGIFLSDMI